MAKVFKLANLSDWVKQAEDRTERVMKASIQEVSKVAQTPVAEGGRMPVVTSVLRNSEVSGLNGGFGSPGEGGSVLTVMGMKIGDVYQFKWTAEYAMRVNYGFVGTDSLGRSYNQQGRHFLEGATGEWDRIVSEMCDKARAAAS